MEGKLLGATLSRDPYHLVLYSNIRRKAPQPASAMNLARFPFCKSFFAPRSSTTMTGLVLASQLLTWCKKSRRMFCTQRCRRARQRTTLAWFREPFRFRASRCDRRRKSCSALASGLGTSRRVLSDSTRNDVRPKSTPTGSSCRNGRSSRSSSQVKLTHQRSASREMVAERILAFPSANRARSLSVRSLAHTLPMRGRCTWRVKTRIEPVKRAVLSGRAFFRLK